MSQDGRLDVAKRWQEYEAAGYRCLPHGGSRQEAAADQALLDERLVLGTKEALTRADKNRLGELSGLLWGRRIV